MNTEDLDWEPPTEAEMKLIEARRERSDQISKLMANYLLKGYKMLGTVCGKCDTILLQDRQGVNYCVACSELDSDTTKDDPVVSQSAAKSMARELELASAASGSPGTSSNSVSGTSANLASQASQVTKMTPTSSQRILTPSSSQRVKSEAVHNAGEDSFDSTMDESSVPVLSMSSIDVQSYPANIDKKSAVSHNSLSPLVSHNLSSPPGYLSTTKAKEEKDISKGKTDIPSEAPRENSSLATNVSGGIGNANEIHIASSESIHVARLMEKIQWASAELSGAHSVEYSIQLCQLMKKAGNAIVALRKARV